MVNIRNVADKLTFSTSPGDVIVDEGSKAVISCDVSGEEILLGFLDIQMDFDFDIIILDLSFFYNKNFKFFIRNFCVSCDSDPYLMIFN